MRSLPTRLQALSATRLWLERLVIGLSLCPWARPVAERPGALRLVHTAACERDALGECILGELHALASPAAGSEPGHETTLVVAPGCWPDDFDSFYTFVSDMDEVLREDGLDDAFQLVSFHPHFRFERDDDDDGDGEQDGGEISLIRDRDLVATRRATDPGDFVNRSPYPTIHLLRQSSVTAAVAADPERAEELPFVNQQRLSELGVSALERKLRSCSCDELG